MAGPWVPCLARYAVGDTDAPALAVTCQRRCRPGLPHPGPHLGRTAQVQRRVEVRWTDPHQPATIIWHRPTSRRRPTAAGGRGTSRCA